MSIRDWIEEKTNAVALIAYELLRLPAEFIARALKIVEYTIVTILSLLLAIVIFAIIVMAIMYHKS
ncbi:MAG: hypothetical protein WC631_00020 [Candidatus Paceibacterota bacterium]|jgi:hypothetical protein